MPRPYSNLGTSELAKLVQKRWDDPAVLHAILDELQHRKRPQAGHLRAKVSARFKEISGEDRAEPRESIDDLPLFGGSTTGPRPRQPAGGRSPDDFLKPPRLFKKLEPIGVSGRPPKYVRSLKTDVVLAITDAMARTARYACALDALITDMRKHEHGHRRVVLENGQSVALDGGHRGYLFAFTDEAEVFEDARVELSIGGRKTEGQIVSISNGNILIAVDEDFGESIKTCVLIIDSTALLQALKDRLEKAGNGERAVNTAIADHVVSNSAAVSPAAAAPESPGFRNLNDRQKEAVCRALGNKVLYLWGPPGTGKTTVLATFIQEIFEQDKKILVCSNTNRAVDQVLFNLCRTLGPNHEAMELGRIVRLGRIAHGELAASYGPYVTLDGIVERRSRDLKKRQKQIEVEINRIDRQAETIEHLLAKFVELDGLRKSVTEEQGRKERYGSETKAAVRSRDLAQERLNKLNEEIKERRGAGALRRAFMRSEETIFNDISTTERDLARHDSEALRLHKLFTASKANIDNLSIRLSAAERELASYGRKELEQEKQRLDDKRQPFQDELNKVNKALSDLEASIMNEARVIGATVTKSYLAAQNLPAFDVVVIDEASMVLLPALYYAAGLAREKVLVSGDFRQLPPIVPTEQKAILDEIGSDVFHPAGIVEAVDVGRSDPRIVMLEEQFRMNGEICALISGPMYQGKLKTAPARTVPFLEAPSEPLAQTLTIVDTSQLWPFETQNLFLSRYNLMHALVIRNLFLHQREGRFIKDLSSLGICTPYAAQAKLIRRLIDDYGLKDLIEAGTVHRYQGDEKAMMIIDIPESVGGGKFIGRFLQGDHPDDEGSKIFNVAVSRAKEHLVVVANLTYLDDRLPGNAILRDILFRMQMRGRVVDGREIVRLRPVYDDLRRLTRPVDIQLETKTTSLFAQKDFDAVFRVDVEQARNSVVIFSGFVTPQRVATYGDFFRRRIGEGIAIRCVTRPPQYNGLIAPELGRQALDALEETGAVVDCRRNIHQKIVLIDNEIAWFGSLNPLSHTAATDETMMRAESPSFAEELARQVAIRAIKPSKSDEHGAARAENPRCENCHSRAFYLKSRKGYQLFICEAECGWTQNLDRAMKGSVGSQDLPDEAPPCSKCGAEMRKRSGPFGAFFGCRRYPNCDGKMNARQAWEWFDHRHD